MLLQRVLLMRDVISSRFINARCYFIVFLCYARDLLGYVKYLCNIHDALLNMRVIKHVCCLICALFNMRVI